MKHYNAHYKDINHDCDIVIDDDNGTLGFTLDGISFVGTCFDDFALKEDNDIAKAAAAFAIIRDKSEAFLHDYCLSVCLPMEVIETATDKPVKATLYFRLRVDHILQETVCEDFRLIVGGDTFALVNPSEWFDLSLYALCQQIKDQYWLKCCFTCQYAEYSPYGGNDFGAMLCYRDHKAACLRVHDKGSYFMELGDKSYYPAEETGLCAAYEPRVKNGGLRGFAHR